MEEEKTSKQKPHTSFNKRLFVAKNLERNMTKVKKNVKIFILQGEHDKGEYEKGYYGISTSEYLFDLSSSLIWIPWTEKEKKICSSDPSTSSYILSSLEKKFDSASESESKCWWIIWEISRKQL